MLLECNHLDFGPKRPAFGRAHSHAMKTTDKGKNLWLQANTILPLTTVDNLREKKILWMLLKRGAIFQPTHSPWLFPPSLKHIIQSTIFVSFCIVEINEHLAQKMICEKKKKFFERYTLLCTGPKEDVYIFQFAIAWPKCVIQEVKLESYVNAYICQAHQRAFFSILSRAHYDKIGHISHLKFWLFQNTPVIYLKYRGIFSSTA